MANSTPVRRIAALFNVPPLAVYRHRAKTLRDAPERLERLRREQPDMAMIARLYAEAEAAIMAIEQAKAHPSRMNAKDINDVHQ